MDVLHGLWLKLTILLVSITKEYMKMDKGWQINRSTLHDMARQLHHHHFTSSFHKLISQTIEGIDVCRFAFQYSFPIDSRLRKGFGNLCMWFVTVLLSVPKQGRNICRNIGRWELISGDDNAFFRHLASRSKRKDVPGSLNDSSSYSSLFVSSLIQNIKY